MNWRIVVLLSVVFTSGGAMGQLTVAMPCNLTNFAAAADGTGVWAICSPDKDNEINSREAGNKGELPTPSRNDPTEVYWVDFTGKQPALVASAMGVIGVSPAPIGHRALITIPGTKDSDETFVYSAADRQRKLAIELPYTAVWAADAAHVYAYGGTTLQADVWNILAMYDVVTGVVTRRKLQEPTEIVEVCRKDGHVFTATPKYPAFKGSTVEYGPDLQFVRRVQGWIGARFSCNCKYVASEQSYHGPLPWSIYDTASGRELFHFDYFANEGKEDSYELIAWNPAKENLMLRRFFPQGKEPSEVQVFDVASGRVRQRLAEKDRGMGWSADGQSVLVGFRREIELRQTN